MTTRCRRTLWIMLLVLAPCAAARAQGKLAKDEQPIPLELQGNLWLKLETGAHLGQVDRLFFTPDSKTLVTVGYDNSVQVWDAQTGRRQHVFLHPIYPKSDFLTDGKTLASQSYPLKATVAGRYHSLLNIETGQMIQLKGLKANAFRFAAHGDLLAAHNAILGIQLYRGMGKVWSDFPKVDPTAEPPWKVLKMTSAAPGLMKTVAFSPDGKTLSAGSFSGGKPNGAINLWKLGPDGPISPPLVIKCNTKVDDVVWSPDSARFAASSFKANFGPINVYSSDGKLLKAIEAKEVYQLADQPLGSIDYMEVFFRSKSELALACRQNFLGGGPSYFTDLFLYDIDKGTARVVHSTHSKSYGHPSKYMVSPDGKRAATVDGGTGRIEILDLDEPAKAQIISTREFDWSGAVWSKEGYKIASTKAGSSKLRAGFDFQTLEPLAGIDRDDFRQHVATPPPTMNADGTLEVVYDRLRDWWSIYKAAKADVPPKGPRQPLLQAFFSGADWIAWTREGYYAASPGGERMVGWALYHGPDQVATFYPAERFRKQLYRPDVIKLVLEKGSVAAALKAADAARGVETRDVELDDLLPPRAVLTVADASKLPTVKVKVVAEASSKEQPITALRLLVDGRPAAGKETLVEFPAGKAKAEIEWTFELPDGEHQLAVLARSADSSGVSPSVSVKNVNQAKLPTLHVLTVGINTYRDTALDLQYAAPDAAALAKAFVKNCQGQPFRAVNIKTLLNKDATAANIAGELLELRKHVAQQDLVVVFFACHGVKHKKEYYLLTHEADVEKLDKTSLSGSDLRKALADYKCQVLLMLDACHAAGFGQGQKLAKLGLKPATDDATRDLTEDDCGVAVMCAAMSHEKAEGKAGHGLFTHALLEALEKKPGVPVPFNRYNQRVYIHHLQAFVFDEVSARSEERQHPFLSLPWVVESFVVR